MLEKREWHEPKLQSLEASATAQFADFVNPDDPPSPSNDSFQGSGTADSAS